MPFVTGRRPVGWCATVALLISVASAYGQSSSVRKQVTATRAAEPPVIDGRLIDEPWSHAEPVSDFTQRDPDEGQPASERTEIRILYDNDALYVAARLFDREPELIGRRLSSRDGLSNRDGDKDADRVIIYLDSMYDRLTGAAFGVSASNVQEDMIIFNDTFKDPSWDAVWQSRVSVDETGWSVEMRVPLSQLRFPLGEQQTWGINVERFIRRKNETVWLERVPKNEAGLASRMGNLTGLNGLSPRRRMELLPYAAARAEFIEPEEAADPFNDGARAFGALGMDLKVGLSSNLTVDATVNPDFGQVEVDPAVVNLTAFETFFPEKRAFFLEGAHIFNSFGQGGSNSFWGFNVSDPSIFYSRRIGRSPQVSLDTDFIDQPAATTIIGAAKLTGKTSGGWNIGLLEAVTGRETARTTLGEVSEATDVEPFTNYAVARVQRELGRRGGAGFMTTAVNRRLDTPLLKDSLVGEAYVFGTDAYVFLDRDRDWVVTGKISGSHVSGTSEAVDTVQRTEQRYYQRPDAPHIRLDPTRTSLAGWAGRVNLNRNSGVWQVNAALWGVSPGFEANDLGFQGTGDRAGAHAVVIGRGETPNRISRSRSMWVAKAWTWNYNRERQYDGWHARGAITFLNYWSLNGGGHVWRRALDDRLTRGGPSAVAPGGSAWSIEGETDARQRFSLRTSIERSVGEEGGSSIKAGVLLSIKPSPMVTISTGPEWERSRTVAQYVTTESDATALATYGERYVFGTLDQTQMSMTTRINVVLTPTVSVQVFAQPLLANGDYVNFKELARPRTFDFLEYRPRGTLAGIRRSRKHLRGRSGRRGWSGTNVLLRQSRLQPEIPQAEHCLPMGDQIWLDLVCRLDAPAGRRARHGPVRARPRHREAVRRAGERRLSREDRVLDRSLKFIVPTCGRVRRCRQHRRRPPRLADPARPSRIPGRSGCRRQEAADERHRISNQLRRERPGEHGSLRLHSNDQLRIAALTGGKNLSRCAFRVDARNRERTCDGERGVLQRMLSLEQCVDSRSGSHQPGAYRSDGDVVARELRAQAVTQADKRKFARRIREHVRHRHSAANRGNVHNPSLSLTAHIRKHGQHRVQGPQKWVSIASS